MNAQVKAAFIQMIQDSTSLDDLNSVMASIQEGLRDNFTEAFDAKKAEFEISGLTSLEDITGAEFADLLKTRPELLAIAQQFAAPKEPATEPAKEPATPTSEVKDSLEDPIEPTAVVESTTEPVVEDNKVEPVAEPTEPVTEPATEDAQKDKPADAPVEATPAPVEATPAQEDATVAEPAAEPAEPETVIEDSVTPTITAAGTWNNIFQVAYDSEKEGEEAQLSYTTLCDFAEPKTMEFKDFFGVEASEEIVQAVTNVVDGLFAEIKELRKAEGLTTVDSAAINTLRDAAINLGITVEDDTTLETLVTELNQKTSSLPKSSTHNSTVPGIKTRDMALAAIIPGIGATA